ncbi:ATP-binding protein [Candidatus Parcubacteria bacterium]|nr:ATP-binding protein [Candidatus Parcubacteria bacterium]
MLTSALAMLFAKERKVVAVDCDADAPNLALWLGGIKSWDKIIPVITSAKPEIDYKKCDGCGLCVENCRFSALRLTPQGKPALNPFLCEGCGACEVICPKGAIKLKPVQNGEIRIKRTRYNFPLVSGQLFPGETGSGKVVDEIKSEASAAAKAMADKGKIIMIIDSAPGTGCPVTAALKDADFTILITEPTPSGFADLKRVLEVVNHFKIPYGVVVNKWDINPKFSNRMEKWARGKFLGKISYDKKIFQAISNLTPIMETNLKAKNEIKDIYDELKICQGQ